MRAKDCPHAGEHRSSTCRRCRGWYQKRYLYRLAQGEEFLVEARPSARLVEGMCAQGYSMRWQSERSGVCWTTLSRIWAHETLRVDTARAIARLADEVGDAGYRPVDVHQRRARSRTLNTAAKNGWLPLIWGTDEEIAELETQRQELLADLELERARAVAVAAAGDMTLGQLADRYDVSHRTAQRWVSSHRQNSVQLDKYDQAM